MTASDILSDCAVRGVRLDPGDASRLRYRGPAGTITADLLAALASHKPALLRLLAGPRCPDCRRPLDEKARCWRCHNRLCSGRGRPTASALIELCVACGNTIPDRPPHPLGRWPELSSEVDRPPPCRAVTAPGPSDAPPYNPPEVRR